MFGPASNCTNCKILVSQIFYNAKKERVCPDCIQKEYDQICQKLNKSFDDLYDFAQKNKQLEDNVSSLDEKIKLYDAILAQIKNFTQLVNKE